MAKSKEWLLCLLVFAAPGVLYLGLGPNRPSPRWVRDQLESQGYVVFSSLKDDANAFYISKQPIPVEKLHHLVHQSEHIAKWRGIVAGHAPRKIDEVQLEQWHDGDYDAFAGFVWFGDRELMDEIRQSLGK
jgi:hypothetical protein